MARALDSGSLSAFCDSVAMMMAAGIQLDEAVYMFKESMGKSSPLKRSCEVVYANIVNGKSLSASLDAAGGFPAYAVQMVQAGEKSGRLESVLRSLAIYYNEEDRLYSKMHSAIVYPAALLVVMTVILLFTVMVILPVFTSVYSSIAGSVSASTYAYMRISNVIGYAALVIMGVGALCAVIASIMCNGRSKNLLFRIMSVMPVSSDAMYHMALSRFTAALATYTSAGFNTEEAIGAAAGMLDHGRLYRRVSKARKAMVEERKSLPEAIAANNIFDPIYNTMLEMSDRSGSTERTLQNLSDIFFDDAVVRTDSLIDSVEPMLAALLTVSVGATLIAVMLPLIGIMGSIS